MDEGSDSDGDDAGNNTSPSKKAETESNYEALAPFRDLYPHSDIVRALKEFGPSIIPLQMIGAMMNYTGNHMLYYIATVLKRKIFYPLHKAVSI